MQTPGLVSHAQMLMRMVLIQDGIRHLPLVGQQHSAKIVPVASFRTHFSNSPIKPKATFSLLFAGLWFCGEATISGEIEQDGSIGRKLTLGRGEEQQELAHWIKENKSIKTSFYESFHWLTCWLVEEVLVRVALLVPPGGAADGRS